MKPPAEQDPVDVFVRKADEVLREMAAAPAVKHLRRAGVELLRAARCGLDGAIDVLEPKPERREAPAAEAAPAEGPQGS